MELKLYVALVAPGASARVKYRHWVALVSFFSLDMWVPLWVAGVGSEPPEQHIVLIPFALSSSIEPMDTP
jgi:hypothetical protein